LQIVPLAATIPTSGKSIRGAIAREEAKIEQLAREIKETRVVLTDCSLTRLVDQHHGTATNTSPGDKDGYTAL